MFNFVYILFMLILSIFGVQIKNYKQDDFIGKTERIDITTSNEEYVKVIKSISYKYNRTDVAYNLSIEIMQDLGSNVEAKVQVFKFTSNEYRRFPINFPVNLCRMLEEDIFGARELLVCGNFTDCPFMKGTYLICKFALDFSKFPPHIPFGRYMVDLQIMYNGAMIINPKLYIMLKDPKWDN